MLIFCVLALSFLQTHAQVVRTESIVKKVLGTGNFHDFEMLNGGQISGNGKYISYIIVQKNPTTWKLDSKNTVFQSTDKKWRYKTTYGSSTFSLNGIYGMISRKDTLEIVKLGTASIEKLTNVKSYKLSGEVNNERIAYLEATGSSKLVLRGLSRNSDEKTYSNVISYQFSNLGKKLILVQKEGDGQILKIINGNSENVLWKGDHTIIGDLLLDSLGNVKLFHTKNKQGVESLYWNEGGSSFLDLWAILAAKAPDMDITNVSLVRNDKTLLLSLLPRVLPRDPKSNLGYQKVWNYRDYRLQSDRNPREWKAVYNLDQNTFHWITQEGQSCEPINNYENFIVFDSADSNRGDIFYFWDSQNFSNAYIFNTTNGFLDKSLGQRYVKSIINHHINSKFVVFLDKNSKSLKSYNLETRQSVNLCKDVKIDFQVKQIDYPEADYYGVNKWLSNQGVLVSDGFDLWLLDLYGKKTPKNITQGYGLKNQIRFSFALNNNSGEMMTLDKHKLFLNGLDLKNKKSGFYEVNINGLKEPNKLSEGDNFDLGDSYKFYGYPVLKAKNADVYLTKRSLRGGSLNLYFTKDFKNFKALTEIYPEKRYNWIQSMLISWKNYDGTVVQGILYKPGNLDSNKKYPVIFNYYEKYSNRLNQFLAPNLFDGDVNIPLLVSQGYLVFVPDIHYKTGRPGQSAYDCVVSGADEIAKLLYVDTTKMAISGHSMGGYETNYILTKTNRFAAALSASGPLNLAEMFTGIFKGTGGADITKNGQTRMGATPWGNPNSYIEQSPIYHLDKISTPLLMMCGKRDTNVPATQVMGLYLSLRLLQKPCWMLEYDDGHSLMKMDDAKDYTIKVLEFFDHYLKGKPAPTWMTNYAR